MALIASRSSQQNYHDEARLIPRPKRSTPEAISHRGAHDTLPENSIPAFLRALELGAQGIELDVHATQDGKVVVHHDPVVRGRRILKKKSRAIADLSARDLESFPLADGIQIPSLDEVLEAVRQRAIVYVEIKAPHIELLVVRCIRESSATCAVHSFDHRAVKNVKSILPAIRTGVLESERQVDPVAWLLETRAEDLWQQADYIDEELVRSAHSLNARVVAWTSNDPRQWKTLNALGVDAICTDRIGELAAFSW